MEEFKKLLQENQQLSVVGGAVAAVCTTGVIVYKIATRKKPTHVSVNCWFCNQDTVVPYGNRNCWDCPTCEQYNGFQENGDYNKPIPAQFMEHLNHGVSGGIVMPSTAKSLQWVNCQMLLCKKCNNNQTLKIRQLASFVPREEDKYDEEIEVYKHHLEQTYKLCRPCQTAVEYYIKHQNRQLRAVLFNYQLKRSRESEKAYMQNVHSAAFSTPARVIFFRFCAFLSCAFLLALAIYGSGDPFPDVHTLHAGSSATAVNNNTTPDWSVRNGSSETLALWPELIGILPEEAVENMRVLWSYGKNHQMAVVFLGLFTCLFAIFLAGRIRLRRVDAVACVLWLLILGFHVMESYLNADVPSWMDTVKFSTTSLCCLVGFMAAVATRKPSSHRRYRARRYLSGDNVASFYNSGSSVLSPTLASSTEFLPSPSPNLSFLVSHQFCQRVRKASPSSLPGRLNRALSLGTIPKLTRTDSGYLFSGSRPPSHISPYKDTASDYFSLNAGSRPSSPGPSPAPSVAGSITSTSSSAIYRRPLISPARFNLKGQRLQLFTTPGDVHPSLAVSPSHKSTAAAVGHVSSSDFMACPYDAKSVVESRSAYEEPEKRKQGSSSRSSTCLVDTTTGNSLDHPAGYKGLLGKIILRGILCISLTMNIIFISVYLYQGIQ
ncbi:transmembrane protein 201 isoform X1 [Erpetoichthys calabaricus]|uniref:Transmembrane protein 201 n=1 Tax=Erpetoichthys calabaricus TaxID=27687 RepID=A0A8C4S199_ERPCA|nr:transmembrane protein 201 isoform X1 [Erpetoichthys calabaricus]